MTPFDKIEEMALAVISDYKLSKLYQQSLEAFQSKMDGLLIKSAMDFSTCKQSLAYDADNRYFQNDLTQMEKYILSCYFVVAWWEWQNNDAAQIALKLGLKNVFTYNSESQNFKEKQNVIDKLREEVSRKITEYQLQDIDGLDY